MKLKRIVRWPQRLAARSKGRTDWTRLDSVTDEDIDRAIADDPDAAPALDGEFWNTAEVVMPEVKVPISIRVDKNVLDFFKAEGRGYQSRINAILSAYVRHHQGNRKTPPTDRSLTGKVSKRAMKPFPIDNCGPWPEGLSLSRKEMYDDDGR